MVRILDGSQEQLLHRRNKFDDGMVGGEITAGSSVSAGELDAEGGSQAGEWQLPHRQGA